MKRASTSPAEAFHIIEAEAVLIVLLLGKGDAFFLEDPTKGLEVILL